jgi:ubiquitin-conjugating enzyme (huntingtin interacting protein 2)
MSARTRRIQKELADIRNDPQLQITISSDVRPGSDDVLSHFVAFFVRLQKPSHGGVKFAVDVELPEEYPFRPPVIKLKSRIRHPQVDVQTVCIST